MKNPTLHLTADYEIFGNGSGDVDCCLIRPSERLMRIAESYGTRITFFVDVCEIWAFEQLEQSEPESEAARSSRSIRNQLLDAVSRGHDIQLHAHPQWIGASWDGEVGKWNVRLDRWRIGRLPKSNAQEELATPGGIISRGVEWLERLAQSVDPGYRCRAFRAGAWSIQPEEHVLEAMRRSGIAIDTSVAPGGFRDDGLSYFDFRSAPKNRAYWCFREKVDSPDDTGDLVEFPIFTSKESILDAVLGFGRRRLQKNRASRPPGCKGTSESSVRAKGRVVNALMGIFSSRGRTRMFDYCALSAGEMVKMVRRRGANASSQRADPIIAIGHPKNFANPNELDSFLKWCKKTGEAEPEPLEQQSIWQRELT